MELIEVKKINKKKRKRKLGKTWKIVSYFYTKFSFILPFALILYIITPVIIISKNPESLA